jgi:hypothetical protein
VPDARGPALDEASVGVLDDRVVRFLAERRGHVAFNALRRSLRAHPESLTRSLRRLERGGVLLRDEHGYVLAEGYFEDVDRAFTPSIRTIASIDLPRGVDKEQLLGSLAGRWFGHLRWVGTFEQNEEPWLVWSVPGAEGHVLLSVRGRRLRVGVDSDRSSERELLESSARDLVIHGLERLPRSPDRLDSATVGFARAARSFVPFAS